MFLKAVLATALRVFKESFSSFIVSSFLFKVNRADQSYLHCLYFLTLFLIDFVLKHCFFYLSTKLDFSPSIQCCFLKLPLILTSIYQFHPKDAEFPFYWSHLCPCNFLLLSSIKVPTHAKTIRPVFNHCCLNRYEVYESGPGLVILKVQDLLLKSFRPVFIREMFLLFLLFQVCFLQSSFQKSLRHFLVWELSLDSFRLR